MTTIDYEKKYKAVLQTATQWIKDGCTDKEKICLECVFPELRESEDERIRKELIDAFQAYDIESSWNGFPVKSILAWLEKQKEQKPVEWEDIKDKVNVPYCSSEPEWSEEDEKMRDSILAELANHICYNKPLDGMPSGTGWTSYKYQQEMDWLTNRLKSLRPPKDCSGCSKHLEGEELYEQLKKLM